MTYSSLFVAVTFFFLTRAPPVRKLAAEKPHSSVLSVSFNLAPILLPMLPLLTTKLTELFSFLPVFFLSDEHGVECGAAVLCAPVHTHHSSRLDHALRTIVSGNSML